MFLNYSSNYRHPPEIAFQMRFPSLLTGFPRSRFPGFLSVLWRC